TAVNTTISNCTNAGEIRFNNAGASAAHRIGGIVAYIVDSCPTLVIDNCTNKGTVVSNMNGNCFIGGIAGVNYAAAIRDCTNEAEVKFVQANAAGAGYLCIGGIAGQTYSGAKVTGCANRAAVSSDKLQVTRIGGIVGTHNASTIDDCSNSGDITLAYTATANNWEAAGGIVGFYDGTDGTAVTNGCTNSGKVSATVNSSNANIGAGGIAGIIKSGHATNNTNDGAVWMHNAQAGKSSYAGGIVGYDYNTKDKSAVTGNVNNGAVQATVEGTSALLAAGGIIGRNDVGAVSGCRNFGAVACALHAGALVGWNKHSVEDSAAGGSVNGTALTGTNYAELAVGFQDGGSSSGITFGEK
ncbi:MAG: GLUG motif-containing protein, partial [Alistipes onderdonkii]